MGAKTSIRNPRILKALDRTRAIERTVQMTILALLQEEIGGRDLSITREAHLPGYRIFHTVY